MRLSSKYNSNLVRMIFIYFIDFSILAMCIGQTTNYSPSDVSVENLDGKLLSTMEKYPHQISTAAAVPAATAKILHSNSTGIGSRRRRKQQRRNRKRRRGTALSTTMPILQIDEIVITNSTQAVTSGKRKNKRRRRKFRKRRRKSQLPHNNLPEITTAKGVSLPIGAKSTNPEGNFDDYKRQFANKTLTLSSGGLFLANLVGPIPKLLGKQNETTVLLKSLGKFEDNDIMRHIGCRKHGCAHVCHSGRNIRCSCLEGFYLAKDAKSCIDINECKLTNGGCQSTCVNTLGSYECRCPAGLRLADDLRSCEDVNECLLRNGHGPCQDTCRNTFGHYSCSCAGLGGTRLAEDGRSCEDLDECDAHNGGCSHQCINTVGRAFCGCPRGMELTDDWRTCRDINECEDEHINITCENGCLNTIGSYHCLGSQDLQRDQASVNLVCKPLFPPSRGFIRCSRNNAFEYFTKKGRKRIINSPGTVCELICPRKYKISKKYYVMCGLDGEWVGEKYGKCLERRNY